MSSLAVGSPDARFGVSAQSVTLVDLLEWRARVQAERVAKHLLSSEAGENHRRYWLKQLGGPLPALALPTDRPRPPCFSEQELEKIAMLLEETDELNESVE